MDQAQRPPQQQQGDSWITKLLVVLLLFKFPIELGTKQGLEYIFGLIIWLCLLMAFESIGRYLYAKWNGEVIIGKLAVRKDGTVVLREYPRANANSIEVAWVVDKKDWCYDFNNYDTMNSTFPLPQDNL
jgi:hypothetical protein